MNNEYIFSEITNVYNFKNVPIGEVKLHSKDINAWGIFKNPGIGNNLSHSDLDFAHFFKLHEKSF